MAENNFTLNKEYLHELLEYRDGQLYWKKDIGSKIKVGNKCGNVCKLGYTRTQINRKLYRNHRLIFLMFNGYLPKIVDHIDGNTSNNRIENLREVNNKQNGWNRRIGKDNTSGLKNVSWNKDRKKWSVQLTVNKKIIYLGLYEDKEEANKIAIKAREDLHKQYARHE